MPLNFYSLDNNEFLFEIDDTTFDYLTIIFDTFTHRTGQVIDQYDDRILSTEMQKIIIAIIKK